MPLGHEATVALQVAVIRPDGSERDSVLTATQYGATVSYMTLQAPVGGVANAGGAAWMLNVIHPLDAEGEGAGLGLGLLMILKWVGLGLVAVGLAIAITFMLFVGGLAGLRGLLDRCSPGRHT